MSSMRVLGVDPGQYGGLAILHGGRLVKGIRMPIVKIRGKASVDARAVLHWWDDCLVPFDVAVIESVHAMPRQGVSSSFQFGRMLGGIETLVASTGARIEYVAPATWKKAMGLGSEKRASIDAAKVRFGEVADQLLKEQVDDGIAEAALLAAYWVGNCREEITC